MSDTDLLISKTTPNVEGGKGGNLIISSCRKHCRLSLEKVLRAFKEVRDMTVKNEITNICIKKDLSI